MPEIDVTLKEETRARISFSNDEIKDSLLGSALPEEIFDDEDLIDWVHRNKTVDELFSMEDLSDWAKENGYIQED
jgi:hypothetical protein